MDIYPIVQKEQREMTEDSELVEVVRKSVAEREQLTDPEKLRGSLRVEVESTDLFKLQRSRVCIMPYLC